MADLEQSFDPILRRDSDIAHQALSKIRLSERVPTFLEIHGQRQTISNWRSALRYTIGIAHRVLHCNASIGDLIGVPVRSGNQGTGWMNMPEIGISIPSLSKQGCAEAVRSIILEMQLPCRLRLEADPGLGVSSRPIVAYHTPRPEDVPEFGSFIPKRRGAAPAFDRGRTLVTEADMLADLRERLQSGEIVVGTWVALSIPGVVKPDRAFRIVEGAGNPTQCMLGATSPVGAAILGHARGAKLSYKVGGAERSIEVMEVDNAPLMAKLGLKLKAPEREAEISAAF